MKGNIDRFCYVAGKIFVRLMETFPTMQNLMTNDVCDDKQYCEDPSYRKALIGWLFDNGYILEGKDMVERQIGFTLSAKSFRALVKSRGDSCFGDLLITANEANDNALIIKTVKDIFGKIK